MENAVLNENNDHVMQFVLRQGHVRYRPPLICFMTMFVFNAGRLRTCLHLIIYIIVSCLVHVCMHA